MVEKSEGQQVETSELINLANGVPKGKIAVRLRDKWGMASGIELVDDVREPSEENIERLIEARRPSFDDDPGIQFGYDLVGGKTYLVGVNLKKITFYAIQYFQLVDDPDYEEKLRTIYRISLDCPDAVHGYLEKLFPHIDFDSKVESKE